MSWVTPLTWTTGQVVTAANLNQQIRDNEAFLYGDTSWTSPTFSGGWVDNGGSGVLSGFRLIGTRVVCRGEIKSGTINTAAFTFPSGYRPTATVYGITASNNAAGFWTVTSAGVFTPAVGSTTEFSLNMVAFDTI